VGAVGAGFLLKAVGSVQACFATLGLIVLAASACAIAVRFTLSHKASEQALYEAALRERELLMAHTGQPLATG
jgi:NNP family nitrate/nitrite transporter-like MFS transporter